MIKELVALLVKHKQPTTALKLGIISLGHCLVIVDIIITAAAKVKAAVDARCLAFAMRGRPLVAVGLRAKLALLAVVAVALCTPLSRSLLVRAEFSVRVPRRC